MMDRLANSAPVVVGATTGDVEYLEIATSVIPEVQAVRFYHETFEKIVKGHPEVPIGLPSVYQAVADTVTGPTHVEESYNRSYVFVNSGTTNASGDPFRVAVRVVGGASARVKSAYFASTDSDDVNVVWSESNVDG